MKVQLLDLKGQYKSIRKEIDRKVAGIIKDQNFVLGEDVRKFEEEIAAYCGTKYAAGVASGTDALILSLRALGIGRGDEVITTPFTFFATAEAVSLVGAKPVFVDIDPRTYNIDPALIEAKVTSRTKAIIPVHLYGQCADMDPIIAIARKHGLKIIEDNAQSIGATYKGRIAGSMGDIGCLSFFPSKNLGAFGDAGAIVTDRKDLAEMVKVLRVHGSSQRYIHTEIGTNSRLDNLQAGVLRVKLKYIDRWIAKRQEKARYYDKHLAGFPLITPYVPSYDVHTYYLYVVRVKGGHMKALTDHLTERGIEIRTYYPVPLHLQPCYADLGYRKGSLKESEKAAEETIALPLYPEITKSAMDHVIKSIYAYFKAR